MTEEHGRGATLTRARSTRSTEEPGQWLVAVAPAGAAVMAQQGGGGSRW